MHLRFIRQSYPLAALAGALTHLAGSIAGVGLALPVGGLACGQVGGKQACSAIAVRAAVYDMDFEHRGTLEGHRHQEKKVFSCIERPPCPLIGLFPHLQNHVTTG